MRRLLLVSCVTVVGLAAPAPATAIGARPFTLATAKHPISAFDVNSRWVAWAEESRRGCTRVFRRSRSTGITVRLTRCIWGIDAMRVYLTGRRVIWAEEQRVGRNRWETEVALRATTRSGLVTIDSAGYCLGEAPLRPLSAGERFLVYTKVRRAASCTPGSPYPPPADVRWVDGYEQRPRPRMLAAAPAPDLLSVAGPRVASVVFHRFESPPPPLEIRDVRTGALLRSIPTPHRLWGIAYGGRYAIVTYNVERDVVASRYDTATGAGVELGRVGIGGEDDEGLGMTNSMSGRRFVYQDGPDIFQLDAATGTTRLVHTRARTPRSTSLSIAGRIVAWRVGRRVFGHRLPALPPL
jgi:hypothetical protein